MKGITFTERKWKVKCERAAGKLFTRLANICARISRGIVWLSRFVAHFRFSDWLNSTRNEVTIIRVQLLAIEEQDEVRGSDGGGGYLWFNLLLLCTSLVDDFFRKFVMYLTSRKLNKLCALPSPSKVRDELREDFRHSFVQFPVHVLRLMYFRRSVFRNLQFALSDRSCIHSNQS